jgi:hypothetical protein
MDKLSRLLAVGAANLAPLNAASVNTGTITTLGAVTPAQSCH